MRVDLIDSFFCSRQFMLAMAAIACVLRRVSPVLMRGVRYATGNDEIKARNTADCCSSVHVLNTGLCRITGLIVIYSRVPDHDLHQC